MPTSLIGIKICQTNDLNISTVANVKITDQLALNKYKPDQDSKNTYLSFGDNTHTFDRALSKNLSQYKDSSVCPLGHRSTQAGLCNECYVKALGRAQHVGHRIQPSFYSNLEA